MALIRINRNPPARQLRFFGLFWLLFIGFLAWTLHRKGVSDTVAGAVALVAAVVPLVGWLYLPLLRWAWIALSYLTWPIGWVLSHVILALVYYLVVTPIGLLLRLLGKDPMTRRLDPKAKTYWIERPETTAVQRYFRQF
jgi:Kef-type K+ transport system membrane component KefB